MSLLDEEHARTGLELLFDQLKFTLRKSEAVHVLGGIRIRIWKEDLRWRLFDNSAADRAAEHITCALGCKTHHGVQFAPSLRTVFREALEGGVGEQSPEFVHP